VKFERYITEQKVKIGTPDPQRARALVQMSEDLLRTAKTITTPNASLSTAYSALRQLLEAICLREGMRVYSHEAYVAYPEHIGEPSWAAQFDRFRKLRNGIEYYGTPVSAQTANEAIIEIAALCTHLKKKYLQAL
jgi:hypothetical protein